MKFDLDALARHLLGIIFCASILLGPNCARLVAQETSPTPLSSGQPPIIFMAGDSTMAFKPLFPAQPERGWGQLLPVYFQQGVIIKDLAKNGRSTKSFIDEGRWQSLVDQVKPGDYVIIHFGHNDQKRADPKRYAAAFGSHQKNLERFVRDVREKKGKSLLATPIARRSFAIDGKLNDTHADYALATRRVAAKLQVPLLDLEKRSAELLEHLGPESSKKLYVWCEPGEFASLPNGKKDDTQLNSFGASRICDLAVDEARNTAPDLAQWLVRAK